MSIVHEAITFHSLENDMSHNVSLSRNYCASEMRVKARTLQA